MPLTFAGFAQGEEITTLQAAGIFEGAGSTSDFADAASFALSTGPGVREVRVAAGRASAWGVDAVLTEQMTVTLPEAVGAAKIWAVVITRNWTTATGAVEWLDCGAFYARPAAARSFRDGVVGGVVKDHQLIGFARVSPGVSLVQLVDGRWWAHKNVYAASLEAMSWDRQLGQRYVSPSRGDFIVTPTGLESMTQDSGYLDVTLKNSTSASPGGWVNDDIGGAYSSRTRSRLLNGRVEVSGMVRRISADFDGGATVSTGGLLGTLAAAHRPSADRGPFLLGSLSPSGRVAHVLVQRSGDLWITYASVTLPVGSRLGVQLDFIP